MPRRVRDATLESRAARAKLKPQGKPYYKAIGNGIHVGYRKGKTAGRWVARLYLGDEDYRVETMADADDATEANGVSVLDFWQAQNSARHLHAQLSAPSAEKALRKYTVGDAVEAYLEWLDGNRKGADDARWRANSLILPQLGKKDAAKLTAQEIRAWQAGLAKQAPRLRTGKGQAQRFRDIDGDPDGMRRRRASSNRVLTILKAALNYAFREGHVPTDREWRRVEPYEFVERARVRYLSVAEAQRLLNACEPAFRKIVQGALQTGARYGELAALKVDDFNPDVGTVTIRDSKSGKPRHIVLTEEGARFFSSMVVGRPGSSPVFLWKGDVWTKSRQFRPMNEACAAANIDPPIGFHGLRHTWASLAVMGGVPLLVVARNMGHADTRMVEKHYGHLSQSYMADAIRAGAPRFESLEETNVAVLRAT